MTNILVIDDEQNIRTMLTDIFSDEGFKPYEAGDWDDGYKILLSNKIDVIILDVCLPKIGGMEILDIVKKDFTGVEVIIISGHGNIDLAVQAIKKGAFDFIEKPLSIEKVLTVIHNAVTIKTLKEENEHLKASALKDFEIIGGSKAIANIKEKIENAAKSSARVLITGDNGTGKELVARSIHMLSPRRGKAFVEVNCAAIPENLIESELFGYEKGAFTGAAGQKKGKFEIAHRGTIFLDEVADMSLNTQAKVLRVLQEMEFERVGGVSTVKVDVRVVSATNKNILKEIEEGNFREDLYYRLNVIPIHVPPLRERKEDISLLIEHFLNFFSKHSGIKKKTFSKDAIAFLTEYPWHGNIREIRNVIERLNIMIETDNISLNQVKNNVLEQVSVVQDDLYDLTSLKAAKDAFEKKFIQKKLQDNSMNVSKTAKVLDIERSHLHKKIKKYSL